MTDTPIEERKFTDREVREILKKAVEKAPSRALVKTEGLSLAELQSIGQEVGIDPARIEDAARSVVFSSGNTANPIFGAPTVYHFERKAPGELDTEDTPEILSVIRRVMGRQGEADDVHGSLEWKAEGDSGGRYVTISEKDGITTVTGAANLMNAAVLTYLPAGVVGALASFIGLVKFLQDGSQIGLIVFLAVFPIIYGILRRVFRGISRSEATKLQQVVDEVAALTAGEGEG